MAGTKFFHESSNGQHEKYRLRSLIDVIADWKAESKARQPDKHADGWVIIFDQFEEMFFEPADGTPDSKRLRDDHRRAFFEELRNLLDMMRDVFVIMLVRKDYMYELRSALKESTGEVPDYLLQRFNAESAMDAIIEPAKKRGVAIDESVAVEIIRGLSLESKLNANSVVSQNTNEVIEPVYLSVVCYELWNQVIERRGEQGRAIELRDLEKICGGKGDSSVLIANVLESWYQRVVTEVAEDQDAIEYRYSPRKIYFEMSKFVSLRGGDQRVCARVPLGGERSGPFPNWLIAKFVVRWLLRWEDGGWYELTHDRLMAPVMKAAKETESPEGRRVGEITKEIQLRIQNEPRLDGTFVKSDEINAAADRITDKELLSIDELEFIYRSILAEGNEASIRKWTAYLSGGLPKLLVKVLLDALSVQQFPAGATGSANLAPRIRASAARAVGCIPDAGVGADAKRKLAAIALEDPDPEVQKVAAIAIARIDSPEYYQVWLDRFAAADTVSRFKMVGVFAHVMNEASLCETGSNFSRYCFDRLTILQRVRVYLRLLIVRFLSGIMKFVYVVPMCAFGAAFFTALVRWMPAMWHFTWTQVLPYQRQPGIVPKIEFTPSAAFEGILQAGCGGVVWGITLSIAVAFAWIVFMRGSPAKTFKRRMATVFACIIGGLAGGVLLDLSILPVYKGQSLCDGGWIMDNSKPPDDGLVGHYQSSKSTHAP